MQVLAAALVLSAGLAGATPPARQPRGDLVEMFRRAQASFDAAAAIKNRGDPEARRLFLEAISGFEAMMSAGVRNGYLYYNIANAYARIGDVGRAIVNYRRALHLLPGDEQIRANLRSVRNLCETQISRPAASSLVEMLFFWHFGTSAAARTRFALAAYALLWVLMTVALFKPRRVPVLVWSVRCVGCVVLVAGASVAWDHLSSRHRLEAVVVADKVTLRKGNGEYYEPQLTQPLSAGVEFRLLETRPDVNGKEWYHVELPDGKSGWLRADQAEVI